MIRMESCNILLSFFLSFFFSTQEVANGSYFRSSEGPEKIFWVLWVHGQQFKVGAVMNLEDLALQPVAQTA